MKCFVSDKYQVNSSLIPTCKICEQYKHARSYMAQCHLISNPIYRKGKDSLWLHIVLDCCSSVNCKDILMSCGFVKEDNLAVSYTHLTLPTKA